jgi:uncharacterized Zn finger protein
MECKDISDHDFEFFKKNKKDFNELPVYKCKRCGMTWEEMVEIRDTQAALEVAELENQGVNIAQQTKKDIEEGFKRLFRWGND